MSKDKIEVNMNVYDIPILVEALEKANEEIERLNKERENDIKYNKYLQKEIIRLNNIINELEKELNKDFNTYMTGNRQNGKIYKAGADNYRMHIYLKLQELKGSESNE